MPIPSRTRRVLRTLRAIRPGRTRSYNYDHDGQLTGTSYSGNFVNPRRATPARPTIPTATARPRTAWRRASSTDRLLFDGTYYYAYDAAGNRTAKFESTTGALDSTATNITIYQWNNANELTGVSQYANYYSYKQQSRHEPGRDTPTMPSGRWCRRVPWAGRPSTSSTTGRTRCWCSTPAGRSWSASFGGRRLIRSWPRKR